MKKLFIVVLMSAYSVICPAQKRFYTPSAYQVSAFDNKNQISLSVAKGNGYDANISYSFSKNFYVLLGYGINNRYEKRSTLFSNYGIKNDNNSFSVALGYFKKVNKLWLNKVALYLGYSKTKTDNYWDFTETRRPDPVTSQYTYGKNNSLFLGSDLIVQERFVEFSISLRLSYFKYDTLSFYDNEPFRYYPISTVKNLNGLTTEFIQGVGLKHKSFKLLLQGGISIPLFSPSAEQTDAQFTNNGGYITIHKETFLEGSLIFRLSLQCNLYMTKKTNK